MNIKGYLITDILHLVGIVPKEKIEHDNLECNKENKLIKTEVLERRKADFYESMINPELLSNSEWEMIYDLEDEYIRRGHFFRKLSHEAVSNFSYINYQHLDESHLLFIVSLLHSYGIKESSRLPVPLFSNYSNRK